VTTRRFRQSSRLFAGVAINLMVRIAAQPYAFLRTGLPTVEKISTILKALPGHNDVLNGLSISVCNRRLVDGTFSHLVPRIHTGTGMCRP
jgi:hypothetical protein